MNSRPFLHILQELSAPLSALYGATMHARARAYRRGIFKVEEVEGAAIISVGNLTTGGTGKTPLVKLIARLAAEEMTAAEEMMNVPSVECPSICILSRGYGRRNPHHCVIVSDGRRLLADALDGGDEPRELAERLLGTAAVISNADRVAAGRWAREHLGSRVLILDDGFQHLRLKRDLNIVTIDATDPWGGKHLLPRGRLREPLSALRRADLVVLTRADQVEDVNEIERKASALSGNKRVLRGSTQIKSTRLLISGMEEFKSAHDLRALAFCALGNPDAFFSLLRRERWELAHTLAFSDHHLYTQAEADHISAIAQKREAKLLLTTAKDAVKLRDLRWSLPCYVIEADLIVDDEMALRALIRVTLARLAK
jgi:tetraacyldisaccharide 4'-kinase